MKFQESMKYVLAKPYFVLFCLLSLLTPLIVSNNTNELYEFPKMFFVYILGLVIICFFLTELAIVPQPIKIPSLWVIIFILANVISTVFSSHPYTSIWGYYTRFNDGLCSILIFFGLYLVMINKLEKKEIISLLKVSCLTLVPIGIIGILEHFGISTEMVSRVYSTFGQPNWLAQYLAMLLPLVLLLTIEGNQLFWSAVYLVGFACLWFTYSVSGIFGFSVALTVLIILLVKHRAAGLGIKKKVLPLLLGSLLIAITNLGMFSAKVNDIYHDVSKFLSERVTVYAASNQVSDPGFIRLGLWQGTLNMIFSSLKNLLVGTGLETFAYSFQPFRLKSLNYSSEWDFVFNKPHNYYLEMWAEAGLLGLISYLLLLIYLIRKSSWQTVSTMAAFIVTNIFGWPVVSTAFIFWLLVSLVEVGK